MPSDERQNWLTHARWVLLALLGMRLVAMVWIPLNDTTEARYGEIARKMLETGDWVTLHQDYGTPFWAKPPLSTWLSAAAMAVFGVNEFAARLPSLLLSIGVIGLAALLAKQRCGRDAAMVASLVLAGSLLFYASAGSVMTDPSLLFATTLSQVAFWLALNDRGRRRWGYLFFVGLGLGLLAKGPLAVVLVGMPIGLWVLIRSEWRFLWQSLPWVGGVLLMLAIAVPWYALAEYRTPGFLDYFIMGEHVHRFLDPGWQGDRYGFSHATPRGMIWLYALVALFPWSLVMPYWLFRHRSEFATLGRGDGDGWLLYVVLWTSMTLVFFTFSGNIIWPYALPMLPGFSLLAAEMWRRARRRSAGRWLPWLALASGAMIAVATVMFVAWPERVDSSQKQLVEAWRQHRSDATSQLFYWRSRPVFSAAFYSAGRARNVTDVGVLLGLLDNGSMDYIAVPQAERKLLPRQIGEHFSEVASFSNAAGTVILLRENPAAPGSANKTP